MSERYSRRRRRVTLELSDIGVRNVPEALVLAVETGLSVGLNDAAGYRYAAELLLAAAAIEEAFSR